MIWMITNVKLEIQGIDGYSKTKGMDPATQEHETGKQTQIMGWIDPVLADQLVVEK